MINMDRKRLIFKTRQVWFSDTLFDIDGYSNIVFSHCRNKHIRKNFDCVKIVTSTINLEQDILLIWENLKKKSCRYAIKRAIRDGIKIKINEDYEEFYDIYKQFIKSKKTFLGIPENLYTIRKYGTLFVAEYNGELIGGHVYLEDGDTILYWISATKRFENDTDKRTIIGNAAHLLHWEAINYAKQMGIKEFDMGGLFVKTLNDEANSIDSFKESFGGVRTIKYNYSRNYDKIYNLIRMAYRYIM